MKRPILLSLAALLSILPHVSRAQEAQTDEVMDLPEVTVSVPRGSVRTFEVAGSVDRVDGSDIREGRMQAQLSEGLAAVPGLQLQNRYNFAQDLQLSIRGFGARSTFGVRGVRLYVDGIPATLPDGQGQTSNIDIASLDRVEILRGPFSALYGNSSGGVLQAFTVTGKGAPRLAYSAAGGSSGAWRQGVEASGSEGKIDYVLSANRYRTDGWRDHSAATRDLVNGKLGVTLDNGGRLTMVFNRVRISAQDPLGLTAGQLSDNPRAAVLADQYNTRKSVLQTQAGLLWEHRIDADQQVRVMLYGGQRALNQFQSIPPSAQQSPQHAGGVIDLDRDYGGVDVRWRGSFDLAGLPFELAAGLSYDSLRESRSGYENYVGNVQSPVLGEPGRLRRLERNRVSNLDPYVQATWHLAEQWTVDAGVRRSQVSFDSRDLYVVGANGDDSGQARYSQTLPVASIRWQPSQDLALYISAGRGFETPTLNELSYRPNGTGGLNFALRPAVNDSLELGAKARMAGGMLTAALFETRTRDEIVTATSSGGRTTFQNAGRTRRLGFELGWQHETPSHWRTQVALTWLDARVRDSFCSSAPCSNSNVVAAGSRIPGIAKQSLFASWGWVPPQGWRAGMEVRTLSRIQANDLNTASAPGYAVVSLYAGYVRQWKRWDFNAFARVDNVADRRYAGSVIVNEGNARYFEPAPGRQWMVGMGATYRF
ncbi:TonB-dependent receptor family protein [Ottowia thiooxydans]|uniref:Iron complex outermembrane receptor protein n=1 Tax=Ottowia thiooxydans TaxID=219182 RepID=A0ABV2QE66_9BURK